MLDFFNHVTSLAALAVVALQQILKLNVVPNGFANRHPVPTLIILSIVAALVVVWRTALQPHAWTDWVLLVSTIAVVAAVVYNMTIKNWAALRSMEGTGEAK